MADLSLPLLTFTTLTLCMSSPICQPPADGQHSICEQHQTSCQQSAVQYDCVRADGAHYIWEPPSGQHRCDGSPQAGEACKMPAEDLP